MSQRVEMRKNVPSGTIILNRPDKHNALSREMVESLQQAFEDFQGEKSVRAVILTASGSTFSSGSDLEELQTTSQDLGALEIWREDVEKIQILLETILRYPKPVIVALNGDAMGLGAALALAADIIIAHENCQFAFPEANYGLSNSVAAALLVYRVGVANAVPHLLTSKPIASDCASRMGLIFTFAPPDFVWAKAHEMAIQISKSAHQATMMNKKFLNESIGETLFTNLSIAIAQMATARTTDAAKEGLAAFVENRPPNFL